MSPARGGMAEACDLEGSDKLGLSDEGSTICVVDLIEGALVMKRTWTARGVVGA